MAATNSTANFVLTVGSNIAKLSNGMPIGSVSPQDLHDLIERFAALGNRLSEMEDRIAALEQRPWKGRDPDVIPV